MHKLLQHILILTASLLWLSSCIKEDIAPYAPTIEEKEVTVTLDFNAAFGHQQVALTRGDTPEIISSTREQTIRNARLLVFENENGSALSPDLNGRLLINVPVTRVGSVYAGKALPLPGKKVTVLGVANLTDDVLAELDAEYAKPFNDPDYVTFGTFSEFSTMLIPLKTGIGGKTTPTDENRVLSYDPDTGLLPIGIDPIQMPEFTEEELAKHTFYASFGYTRVDIIVDPLTAGEDVELVEASLVNIPNRPLYYGDITSATFYGFSPIQPRSANINTQEQPTAETSKYLIQGLYCYPNLLNDRSITNPEQYYSYAIVKAKTAVSELEGGEYYKILIVYTELDPVTSLPVEKHNLGRNTRYRLMIDSFAGNGYATFEEALDAPPSNVKYEIEMDADAGNEFVITNGTIYMALSNTHIHTYGTDKDWLNRPFPALTVFFAKNDSDEIVGGVHDTDKSIHISKGAGIEIVDAASFNDDLTEGVKHTVEFKITDTTAFENSGYEAQVIVRVGDLVQTINYKHYLFTDLETTITNYETDDYIFGYLEFITEGLTSTYVPWILFDGNSVFEYNAHNGGGVPISLSALNEGIRDNFECPIYLFNTGGRSTKVLIHQEEYEEIDYSVIETVNSYIGGSYKNAATLTLSNTYILNPGSVRARKYYIPVSSRIEEVWRNYGSEAVQAPYDTTGDGKFDMPTDWGIKVIWYDSRRIFDGGLEFVKDTPNPITGEERMSIVIPANIQYFGNVLVSVTDNAGNILWNWTLWVTDYNPTAIARKSTPLSTVHGATEGNGIGSYTEFGFTPHTEGMVDEDAVEHYGATIWNDTGIYGKRFIMDRHLGAFENSLIGHGTLLSDDNSKCLAEPIAGSGLYQHGNPRLIVGSGALKPDGTRFSYTTVKAYATIIQATQRPENFYYGSVGFGTWINSAEGLDGKLIWFDKNIPYISYTSTTEAALAMKSIFDPSPLGWMVVNPNAFADFSRTTGTFVHNAPVPSNTYDLYMGFAQYFYCSYRTSDQALFRLAKGTTTTSAYDGWVRGNTVYNVGDSFSLFCGSFNSTCKTNTPSGKGSALSTRSVTQAEYDGT